MNYAEYFRSLDADARKQHAARAGTTADYINIHLIPRRKDPRRETMERLAAATGGACSYEDLVHYFYLDDGARAA